MYTLNVSDLNGLVVHEAVGTFTPADIWELVGAKARVATFSFVPESPSHRTYGARIVAATFYPPEERRDAPASLSNTELRLETAMREIEPEPQRALKYKGVALADIASILYLPIERPVEHHDSGEKKIPNVIEIPFEPQPGLNVDRLEQNYLISKNNHGDHLAPFEKAQLMGSLLAFGGGRVDGRIAEHFGFSQEALKSDLEVRWHYLSVKERQGLALTAPEREWLQHLAQERRAESITTVLKELKACRADRVDPNKLGPILERVLRSAVDFRPDVLLHGKHQIYWDLPSYAHITMRHVKELQVIEGTAFPYKSEDLKMLIEKVLGRVQDEIRDHFKTNPDKVFYLAGRRCVYFNEDYYAFHIEPTGRLKNFHRWDSRRHERKNRRA